VEVLLVLCFLVVLLVVAGVVCEVAPIVFPSVGGVSPHQVGFSGSPHFPRVNVSVGQNMHPTASPALMHSDPKDNPVSPAPIPAPISPAPIIKPIVPVFLPAVIPL